VAGVQFRPAEGSHPAVAFVDQETVGGEPRFGEPLLQHRVVPASLLAVPGEGGVVDRQPGGVVVARSERAHQHVGVRTDRQRRAHVEQAAAGGEAQLGGGVGIAVGTPPGEFGGLGQLVHQCGEQGQLIGVGGGHGVDEVAVVGGRRLRVAGEVGAIAHRCGEEAGAWCPEVGEQVVVHPPAGVPGSRLEERRRTVAVVRGHRTLQSDRRHGE
jgi:hypothetical protein